MADIEFRGLREAIKDIERLSKEYPDITRAEAEKTLQMIAARMESATVMKTPAGVSGSGGLRGSVAGSVSLAQQTAAAVWGSPLPYAEVVEFGRKPGTMPPQAPLELWAIRKLDVDPAEAPGVARAIAWKIFRKGTKGAKMFEKAWDENERWAYGMIAALPEKIVKEAARG